MTGDDGLSAPDGIENSSFSWCGTFASFTATSIKGAKDRGSPFTYNCKDYHYTAIAGMNTTYIEEEFSVPVLIATGGYGHISNAAPRLGIFDRIFTPYEFISTNVGSTH